MPKDADKVDWITLDAVRFKHFTSYALGQHEAWATVLEVIARLKGEPIEEEEDGGLECPGGQKEEGNRR